MICIVDDDESVLEAIKCLVRSLGYNTATFSSAEEFLDSGPVEGMECLITDVQMPGLSGPELQDRLISDGFRMPVIFVTAHPEERLRERVLRAGAIGYLSKPFREEHMIECLDRALNNPNGQNGGL
jgi:FixJ family two-component response regulator